MSGGSCPRCRLPAAAPHATDAECIAALGATVASLRAAVDELERDLSQRREREAAAAKLAAEAKEAGLDAGG